MTYPIVVCVGNARKMDFIRYWTRPDNRGSYDQSMFYSALNGSIILVDTPANPALRKPEEYSIDGIFKNATMVLDFGDWSITEVEGSYAFPVMPILKASYDPYETMQRILRRHGVNVPLPAPHLRWALDRPASVSGSGASDTQDAEGAATERSDGI